MRFFEKTIEPDVESLLNVIRPGNEPRRVHFIELFLDEEIKEQICQRFSLDQGMDTSSEQIAYNQKQIRLHKFLGYEVFRIQAAGVAFAAKKLKAEDTTIAQDQKRPEREWAEEHAGPIQSWEDFEKYPWPDLSVVDRRKLDWFEANLPANMGVYDLTAHILEDLTFLLGYENMCYKLFEEPDLVDAVLEKVGSFYVDYTTLLCKYSCVKLIWGSDDMGFRTGTLVSPQVLREKIFPWHKKCAQITHENKKLYLLHACGRLEQVMDDLIDGVRIDAKHSYEDTILPVTQAKKLYGNRIAILGGIDVDFLCTADEEAIRKRVRETLDVCMPGGGYCLGTGNTVANYIPLDNYLAMLDEGRNYCC
ncbi:MAG: uroporphyrinogen decarboxylase family protein [Planctomycetota bacterium]